MYTCVGEKRIRASGCFWLLCLQARALCRVGYEFFAGWVAGILSERVEVDKWRMGNTVCWKFIVFARSFVLHNSIGGNNFIEKKKKIL